MIESGLLSVTLNVLVQAQVYGPRGLNDNFACASLNPPALVGRFGLDWLLQDQSYPVPEYG
jgi:hypothetical protein